MKKIFCFLLCCLMIVCFSACSGNTRDVKIKTVESNIYSQEDIDDAIHTIIREFHQDWSGCKLTEIYYAGDDNSDNQYYADMCNADEAIELLSSFDVNSSGGDGSLNPNSTYDNWKWILVRDKGGKWKHVDHGYG